MRAGLDIVLRSALLPLRSLLAHRLQGAVVRQVRLPGGGGAKWIGAAVSTNELFATEIG